MTLAAGVLVLVMLGFLGLGLLLLVIAVALSIHYTAQAFRDVPKDDWRL